MVHNTLISSVYKYTAHYPNAAKVYRIYCKSQ